MKEESGHDNTGLTIPLGAAPPEREDVQHEYPHAGLPPLEEMKTARVLVITPATGGAALALNRILDEQPAAPGMYVITPKDFADECEVTVTTFGYFAVHVAGDARHEFRVWPSATIRDAEAAYRTELERERLIPPAIARTTRPRPAPPTLEQLRLRLDALSSRLIPGQLLPARRLLALFRNRAATAEELKALVEEIELFENEAGITPPSGNGTMLYFLIHEEDTTHQGSMLMGAAYAESRNASAVGYGWRWMTQTEFNLRCDASGRTPHVLLRTPSTLPAGVELTEEDLAPPAVVNTAQLGETRRRLLAAPSLLDMNSLGRCIVGLTLSRVVGRQLGIEDKHQIPHLALAHLGLAGARFDALYRIAAWPDDLRERWHAIPARRDWENHPLGHLADDAAERRERAVIAAAVIERFINSYGAFTATVRRPLQLIDHTKPEREEDVKLQPGTYTLRRVPNPYGYDGNWLVVEGTTTGMTEASWLERARTKGRGFDLAEGGQLNTAQ